MIVRWVHMEFDEVDRAAFLDLFDTHCAAIASQPGCSALELVCNADNPCQISTLSHWDSVEDLNRYRHSALFAEVWPATKALFCSRPHATTFTLLRTC
jgi:quinol monooxygenase YgiN